MSAERDRLWEVLEEGRRIVPAPTNPMAVARAIVAATYERGDALRLRHHRGNFYAYDGTCWTDAEERGIRAALYRFLEDAAYVKTTKAGEQLADWQPTANRVHDVIDAVRAIVHLDGTLEAPAWTVPHQFDATEIVAHLGGLLHVPSRTELSHTPTFFGRHSLPFAYDPMAPAPARWLAFLAELWPDDPASIDCLQEIIGYLLAGGTGQQKIILIVGPKRSGKGTIGRVLTGLLGRHNVAAPTMASLATNFGLQELIGRPLALISDARLGKRTDSSAVVERLLSVSGEDTLTIDRKYRDPWTGRLPTRFAILTNEVPSLADASGALASRFVLLVLTRSFYGRENPRLTDELLAEAPGIFNWALEGLDRLNDRGYFRVPPSSAEAIEQIQDLAAPVAAFLRQRCAQRPDAEASTEAVWTAWKAWCADENRHPGTKATFGRDLKAAAPNVRRTRPHTERGGREHVYAGLRLLAQGEHGDAPSDETMRNCRDCRDQEAGPGPGSPSSHGKTPLHGLSEDERCAHCGGPVSIYGNDGTAYCARHSHLRHESAAQV